MQRKYSGTNRHQDRFRSLREVWILFNQHPVVERKGLWLNTKGDVLSFRDCSTIQRTLNNHGLMVTVVKRKFGEVKFFTIFVSNDNKDKLWILFDPFEREYGAALSNNENVALC